MNRHDLGCLAVAITSYLTSKYFTELAPGTQAMRRRSVTYSTKSSVKSQGRPLKSQRCGKPSSKPTPNMETRRGMKSLPSRPRLPSRPLAHGPGDPLGAEDGAPREPR
jgi:hypothetical protein